MEIKTHITINKSAIETWEVMGKQFANIHEWASFFISSKPSGESKFEGINYAARETVVLNGENTHTLDVFDNANHTLSYTVTAGAPPFADKASAEWSLESTGENTCQASITVFMELKEMVPAEKRTEVEMWLKKSSEEMLDDMKHYLETGNVHPRKANKNS